jgi:hypothetical protein
MSFESDRQLEIEAHKKHLQYIYSLRWGGLVLSALTLVGGAVMTFRGLEGSFNWAVEIPHSIGAKLTNASPGIIFATIGLILGFVAMQWKPVGFIIKGPDSQSEITASDEPRESSRVLILVLVGIITLLCGVLLGLFLKGR